MITVFPVLAIDRAAIRWEEHLGALTPVERRDTVQWKREDYFAPLGYGGINGAKLRQCIWLTGEAKKAGAIRMISGASVKSPQLSMGTAVAYHFGLPTTLVIGAPRLETAMRHENVLVASVLGAEFDLSPVAYNPALQARVRALSAADPSAFVLQYGITVEDPPDAVEQFHRLGSEQVRNFPAEVTHLVLPAGSCNTCTSVLYGLARFPPPSLRRVTLFGIGPTRLDWIDRRLRIIEEVSGLEIRSRFRRRFHHHPGLDEEQDRDAGSDADGFVLEHYDLHATKFAGYQDERPFTLDGIELHPTYEGKVLTYLHVHRDRFPWFWARDGKTLFWIVGSKPRLSSMESHLRAARDRL